MAMLGAGGEVRRLLVQQQRQNCTSDFAFVVSGVYPSLKTLKSPSHTLSEAQMLPEASVKYANVTLHTLSTRGCRLWC